MKKIIDLEDMSHVNCSRVLNVIREHKEISRKQIADITGLSWGGMTKIVNKLFEGGYIVESKDEDGIGIGRTPNIIRLNGEQNFVVALDINRMGFSACVMNLAGDLQKEYFLEETFDHKEDLLHAILTFAGKIVEEFHSKKISAIGVAMQGILDVEQGISVSFPHCPDWENVPIKTLLEEAFDLPVFVEHDPNCMLYSMMNEGAHENALLFRIDKSVGMAASVNGKILRGNALLEVAHCITIPNGKPCKCGRKGCLEAYVSPCLANGEPRQSEIEELLEPLAICMNNMVHIFHADKIILTGSLIKYQDLFAEALCQKFYHYFQAEDVRIAFVQEPGLAVRGAAFFAIQGAIHEGLGTVRK